MSDHDETLGRRVVAWMYVGALAVAGVFGFVLGEIIYGNGGATGPLADGPQPQYGSVGPVVFELNGPNLALFGVLAVGLLLGVGLAAIVYVSRRAESA